MWTSGIIEAFDARADGRKRKVEVSRQRVIIARTVGGVEMRVALEPRQFRGVLFTVLIAEGTDFLYQVRLLHADADMNVTLADCDSEAEACTLWRRWAHVLGLPRLVERAEGEIEVDRSPLEPTPGERRRGRTTLRRRNRFLARRKTGGPLPVALVAPADA
jgi:Family of unknown function (DUF6101)